MFPNSLGLGSGLIGKRLRYKTGNVEMFGKVLDFDARSTVRKEGSFPVSSSLIGFTHDYLIFITVLTQS